MVKYSDDTDYEQIELATMYDLRDARLVLAQIVSIDRANNCAEITIEESCEELAGKDLSAVPFFYHCEDSTGTLEDLARGNKAFKDDEYVYCLWAPTAAELDERFYIIGHADIRVTKTCNVVEILVVRTRNIIADYFTGMFYALVDGATGRLVDLDAFENLDEFSPAKPSAAFGVWSTSIQDWLNYNFRAPVKPTEVGFGPSRSTPTGSIFDIQRVYDSGSTSYVNYTGTQGFIISSTPMDCDAWHDPGNGGASFSGTNSGSESVFGDAVYAEQTVSISMGGAFGSHGSLSVNDCRAYFGTYTKASSERFYAEKDIDSNQWMQIYDHVTAQSYYISVWHDFNYEYECTSSLSESGDLYAEVEYSRSEKVYVGFVDINRDYEAVEVASAGVQTYSAGWSEVDSSSTVYADSVTGTVSKIEGYQFCFYEDDNTLFVGELGAYIITSVGILYRDIEATTDLFSGSTTSGSSSTWIGSEALEGYTPDYGSSASGAPAGAVIPAVWHNSFSTSKVSFPINSGPYRFKVAACALISPFNNTFGVDATTTVGQCIQNNRGSASIELTRAINNLYDYIADYLQAIADSNPSYESIHLSYYESVITYGPYFYTVVRGAGL